MDGTPSDLPVNQHINNRAPRTLQRKSQLKTNPLTPLHRLAKFKAIRDRNLAKPGGPRRSISHFGTHRITMEQETLVVSKSEMKTYKMKIAENVTNGDNEGRTNGNEHVNGKETGYTNGAAQSKQAEINSVGNKSPTKTNSAKTGKNGMKEGKKIEEAEASIASGEDSKRNKKINEEESGRDGTSGKVADESPAESLNLQVSGSDVCSDGEKPGTFDGDEPSDQVEVVKPPTPEVVRRLRSGMQIHGRRNLHGDDDRSTLKRKFIDDEQTSGKRLRDDGTVVSPGWQFFSPSRIVKKFWSAPQTPEPSSLDESINDSIAVNIDEHTQYVDCMEESQPPPNKWCSVM